MRLLGFLFTLVVYALFFGTFLYLIGWITDLVVPRSIEGPSGYTSNAILINVGLWALFGVQHSIMARRWFKARWTKVVPAALERSVFVLITCLILGLTFWQYRPMPEAVWHFENGIVRGVLWGICFLGFGIVFISTFLIDHFELFGLKQGVRLLQGKEFTPPPFRKPLFYKWVRHPLYLGFPDGLLRRADDEPRPIPVRHDDLCVPGLRHPPGGEGPGRQPRRRLPRVPEVDADAAAHSALTHRPGRIDPIVRGRSCRLVAPCRDALPPAPTATPCPPFPARASTCRRPSPATWSTTSR